jgi:hypothetical protein
MRKSLVLALVAVLACSSMVFAGVPDPARSGCAGTAATAGANCQFRFQADGSGDPLVAIVTLRDAFDSPVVNCSTSVTFSLTGACECTPTFPIRLTAFSDSSGIATFNAASPGVGGVGTLDLAVTTHCAGAGNIGICSQNLPFTTPDLNASCDGGGAFSTNVFDLGAWAGGLPPAYLLEADYDCDGTVGVFDLGYWAGGLTVGCP